MSLEHENQSVVLLVVHCPVQGWLVGRVSLEVAMTVWATCSEDPSTWEEVEAYWPRYRSTASGEFVSGLPLQPSSEVTIGDQLASESDWVAVELTKKRLLTGRGIQEVGRDAVFRVAGDEEATQGVPLPFHLPPWWELGEHVSGNNVFADRQQPVHVPLTDRDLLFGHMLHEFVASRIQTIETSQLRRLFIDHDLSNKPWEDWTDEDKQIEKEVNRTIVEIHRDWLMTPLKAVGTARSSTARPDATKPRDLLHGAADWIDCLTDGQRVRFQAGLPMVAAPEDTDDFARAPMGREEVILYFDYCRAVIDAGCFAAAVGDDVQTQLQLMRQAGQQFLESPHEDGPPPNFTIQCCRRRVPQASGVSIVGMDEVESENHVADCDCPICEMMESCMFGPSFTCYDGHHLELDGEFAFSLIETLEEWEAEQRGWREMDEQIRREMAESQRQADDSQKSDPWHPVWEGVYCDEPLPGDESGHLDLAFRLAEITSDLQRDRGDDGNSADKSKAGALSRAFGVYREAAGGDLSEARRGLDQQLERAAEEYPTLRPKVSDFLSRLDEHERRSREGEGPIRWKS